MFTGLPRAANLLRLTNPRGFGVICIRQARRSTITGFRKIHATIATRQLKPPIPPDVSNNPGVDLDEFVGSPGWTLEDLLPPSRADSSSPGTDDDTSISSKTLHHLLNLSGLRPPTSRAEESKLLSALHDQLHFVRHVQSVPTENVEPLIRIGDERAAQDGRTDGLITFEDCIEESESETTPGLEWTEWDVCGLKGGSQEGRDQGWFVVQDKPRANGNGNEEDE